MNNRRAARISEIQDRTRNTPIEHRAAHPPRPPSPEILNPIDEELRVPMIRRTTGETHMVTLQDIENGLYYYTLPQFTTWLEVSGHLTRRQLLSFPHNDLPSANQYPHIQTWVAQQMRNWLLMAPQISQDQLRESEIPDMERMLGFANNSELYRHNVPRFGRNERIPMWMRFIAHPEDARNEFVHSINSVHVRRFHENEDRIERRNRHYGFDERFNLNDLDYEYDSEASSNSTLSLGD